MLLTSSIRAAIEGQFHARSFGEGQQNAELARQLQNAQTHSLRFLYGAAAMAAILFIVMIVFIFQHRDNMTALMGLSAVFGTGIAGLIALVVGMSRTVTQAGILLAMVSQLPNEDVLEALKALLHANGGTVGSGVVAGRES